MNGGGSSVFCSRANNSMKKKWHGVLALGEGTGGRATAWVKVDENDTIIDVRDICPTFILLELTIM
jgi:hypothetical protein